MAEFKAFWQNYVNFSDRTDRRGYWMAFLFLIIAAFIVGLIAGITGIAALSTIWSLVILIPTLAMGIRRLRDAGKHWAWILINFTVIGVIVYIIFLCLPSVPDDGTPVV